MIVADALRIPPIVYNEVELGSGNGDGIKRLPRSSINTYYYLPTYQEYHTTSIVHQLVPFNSSSAFRIYRMDGWIH